MSIARVTMVETYDEGMMDKTEELYGQYRDQWFPNLEQVINIRTGPTSGISIALYPSFEEAEKNLDGRAKMLEIMGKTRFSNIKKSTRDISPVLFDRLPIFASY